MTSILIDQKKIEAILISEKQLFQLSKIKESHIKTDNFYISKDSYIHYTEIDITPRNSNNTLLIIHGYPASGCMFFKVINELSSYFHLILIDLPGMGLSSRKKAPYNSLETCIDYFVISLLKFVVSFGLERFTLFGFSLGCYFSSHMYSRIRERVIDFYMVSPAGFNPLQPNQIEESKKLIKTLPFWKRFIVKLFYKKIFDEKKNPVDLIWSPFVGIALHMYLKDKMLNLDSNERQIMKDYLKKVISLPRGSENCVCYVLKYGHNSEYPILQLINKEDENKIHLIYGEKDLMDFNLSKKSLEDKGLNIKIHFVKDTGHNIMFKNPDDLCKLIIENSKFLNK